MIIELDYITVNYKCGCVAARPVRRPRQASVVYSQERCKIHEHDEALRAQKPQENVAVYYMVDGHKMNVHQSSGYWVGRCYENGKAIRKYFGKSDPRPLLEEAL